MWPSAETRSPISAERVLELLADAPGVEVLDDEVLGALVRDDDIAAHKARRLRPTAPVVRGTAQNPDVFFQAREAANPFHAAVPAVVEQVNAVEVSVGDEDWVADEASDLFDMSDALQPGMSQVDSVEIDGSTVRGTATFVRELSLFVGDEPEVVTGTFEATCGEERLS